MAWVFNPFTGTFDVTGSGGSGTPGGSDTNVQYNNTNAFAGDTEFSWYTASKRLRVGGSGTPGFRVDVQGATTTDTTIGLTLAPVSSSNQPRQTFVAARGTLAGFSAVNSGDLLGTHLWTAYDGSNSVTTMAIQAVADETFNAGTSQRGSHLSVFAPPPGGDTTNAERIRMGATTFGGGVADAAGYLAIGDNSATTKFSKFICRTLAADLTYTLPPSLVAGGVLTDAAGTGTLTWAVPSGTSGTGAMGPAGMDGLDGEDSFIPGPQGMRGLQGLQGIPGLDGSDGEDGLPGVGIQGLRGIQGLQGPPGLDGDDSSNDCGGFMGMSRPFNHHSDLFNFVNNDDHTQYLLLAGRTSTTNNPIVSTDGDGTIVGSHTTAKKLLLQGNDIDATTGTVDVKGLLRVVTTDPGSMGIIGITTFPGGITNNSTNATLTALSVNPTVSFGSGGISTAAVFNYQPTFSSASTARNHGSHLVYAVQPVFDLINGFSGVGQQISGLYIAPNLQRTSGTNTKTWGSINGMNMDVITVSAGWTVTDLRGIWVNAASIAGTVTTMTGCDIEDISPSVGTALSVRSIGTTVEMRHAGPAMFGINAAPTSTNGMIMELERTHTLAAGIADGFAAGATYDPGYTGAFTVTRHNYLDLQNVSVAASAVVTDSAVFRFDAATGTHKALASSGAVAVTIGSGPTGSTAGAPQGWMKINVNGTLRYIPFW